MPKYSNTKHDIICMLTFTFVWVSVMLSDKRFVKLLLFFVDVRRRHNVMHFPLYPHLCITTTAILTIPNQLRFVLPFYRDATDMESVTIIYQTYI